MNEVVKYWDGNLILRHIGKELNWLFSYLDDKKIESVSFIDIGGNVGKFYDEVSKKYNIKKCIIVEPSKVLYDYMVNKFEEKDSVEIHNFAISDKNGSFQFYDSAGMFVDMFEKEEINDSINLGLSKLSHDVPGDTKCYSMDFFMREICNIKPNEIDFIKIDTENSDLQIIKSMTNFFVENKIRPLILFENNYHNSISETEALDIINNFCNLCGYEKIDLSMPGDNILIPLKKEKTNNLTEVYRILQSFKIDKKFWRYQNLTGEDYDIRRSKPAPYIKTAIEIAKALDLKNVVEIGSPRYSVTDPCLKYFDLSNNAFLSPPCCCDGHGGFFWSRAGFEVYTVDIDENCKNGVLWSYGNLNIPVPENLHVEIPRDGIEFLQSFDKTIDVLFLDGWDIGTPEYAEKHLEAYLAAENKLSPTHLVLIDDTDYITQDGGKDKLLSPYLIDKGYIPLFNGRQTLYMKYE